MQLTLLDYFLRILPEAIIFIFASYAISRTKASKKRWFYSSILLSMSVFLIRSLPITYGVHIILNLIVQTAIVAKICKINILNLIKSGIGCTILLLLLEGGTMFIYDVILNIDLSVIFQNDIKKMLYGMPSLIIFALIVKGYYGYLYKENKLNEV